METVYSSKIDIWLAAVILVTALGLLLLTWHLTKTKGMTGVLIMLPALLGAVGLPVWLMVDTREKEQLISNIEARRSALRQQ